MGSSPQTWDFKRFLRTLDFFDAIPLIGNLRWLWPEWRDRAATPTVSVSEFNPNTSMTSVTPTAIYAPLPSHSLLHTWQPEDGGTIHAATDVTALQSCAQLVLILAPLVDPPWRHWRTHLSHWLPLQPNDCVIADFAQLSTEAIGATWGAVDDVVMGGVSQSGLLPQAGYARFQGNVSTENSGGFASVRTRNLEPPLDLSGCTGLQIRLRGDGNRYKFIVRNSAGWDSTAYCYSFDTQAGQWQTVMMPFAAFVPTFRAKTVPDAPPLDPAQIRSLQLMLSKFEYDRELNPRFTPGTFQLDLRAIAGTAASESTAAAVGQVVLVGTPDQATELVAIAASQAQATIILIHPDLQLDLASQPVTVTPTSLSQLSAPTALMPITLGSLLEVITAQLRRAPADTQKLTMITINPSPEAGS